MTDANDLDQLDPEPHLQLLRDSLKAKQAAETVSANAHAHVGPDQVQCERCSRQFIKRRPWARFCSTGCKDLHATETAEANARDAARYRKLRTGGLNNGLYVADSSREWRQVRGQELDELVDDAECPKP